MALKTLVDHATDESAAYAATRKRAVSALADVAAKRATAQTRLDARIAELVALSGEADALRARLALGPPAATAEQLSLSLEAKVQEVHAQQLACTEAQDLVGYLDARALALSRHAELAAGAERELSAWLATATARLAEQQAWAAAIAVAPLADVKADAASAAAAKGAAAKAKLREKDLPGALFDRAEARWGLARRRLDAVDEAADAAELEAAKETGPVEEKRLLYERARADLRAYATTAQQVLDGAITQLDAVLAAPALDADAAARLAGARKLTNGDPDPESERLFADGTAAAVKEGERDAVLIDVDTKRRDVDPARIAAIRGNPDREIENVQAVKDARKAVKDAQPTAEQTAYSAVAGAINAWEAAVPEDTWAVLAAYESATATLADLAAATPASLAPALQAAEDGYVAALSNAGKAERVRWSLGLLAARRAAAAAVRRRSAEGRLLAALRGDRWEDE